MTFYKYNGAGNDFLIADNRDASLRLEASYISAICDRHYGIGADGVMLLGAGRDGFDFTMDYYNADGSGGMMCGNGGRCIVAFAKFLGLTPSSVDGRWSFLGPDGGHEAYILCAEDKCMTVRLKMIDINVARHYDSLECAPSVSGWFIDTGTRHFVRFVGSPVDAKYVEEEGRRLRRASEFAPAGSNVNFVLKGNPLKVRTFEKGVEAETCACGTGVTATAAAAWLDGVEPASRDVRTGSVHYDVDALNDRLSVDFIPACPDGISGGDGSGKLFSDVWLTGPATLVAKIDVLF